MREVNIWLVVERGPSVRSMTLGAYRRFKQRRIGGQQMFAELSNFRFCREYKEFVYCRVVRLAGSVVRGAYACGAFV